MNVIIAIGPLVHSLLHISNDIPFCDVGFFCVVFESFRCGFMYQKVPLYLKHLLYLFERG